MSVQAILIKADTQAYRAGFEGALAGMAGSAKYFREQDGEKGPKIATKIEAQMQAIAEYVGALEAMLLEQECEINETKRAAVMAYQNGFSEAAEQAEREKRREKEAHAMRYALRGTENKGEKEWERGQSVATLRMQMPHLF